MKLAQLILKWDVTSSHRRCQCDRIVDTERFRVHSCSLHCHWSEYRMPADATVTCNAQHSVNIPYASDESESSSRRTPHLRSCACTGRQCRRTRPRRMNSRWAPSPATESCRRTCRWRRGTSLLVVRPALRTPVRLAELGKSIRVASRPASECRRSVRSQCKAASHGHVLIRRCRSPKPLRSSRRGAILVSEMRGLKS